MVKKVVALNLLALATVAAAGVLWATAQTGSVVTTEHALSWADLAPNTTTVGTGYDLALVEYGMDKQIGAKSVRCVDDCVMPAGPALDPTERGGVGVAWAAVTGSLRLTRPCDDGLLAKEVDCLAASVLATSVVRAGSSHRAYDQFVS